MDDILENNPIKHGRLMQQMGITQEEMEDRKIGVVRTAIGLDGSVNVNHI